MSLFIRKKNNAWLCMKFINSLNMYYLHKLVWEIGIHCHDARLCWVVQKIISWILYHQVTYSFSKLHKYLYLRLYHWYFSVKQLIKKMWETFYILCWGETFIFVFMCFWILFRIHTGYTVYEVQWYQKNIPEAIFKLVANVTSSFFYKTKFKNKIVHYKDLG